MKEGWCCFALVMSTLFTEWKSQKNGKILMKIKMVGFMKITN